MIQYLGLPSAALPVGSRLCKCLTTRPFTFRNKTILDLRQTLFTIKKKKNEIMPLAATWMDLEIIILSEVSQTEKDKYHMTLLVSRILKNDEMNLFTK